MLARTEARATQRELRSRILDSQVGTAPRAMLDCAAHMLLYADDLERVEHIGMRHLLERFEATRIDLGFGSPHAATYMAAAFERREDCDVPNPEGIALPNRDRGIQIVWEVSRPVYIDIERDPALARMRQTIRDTFRTKAKIARRLEYKNELFGIICVDDTEEARRWEECDHAYLDRFVLSFLAPILYESRAMQTEVAGPLTEAEKAVVRLAAVGLTYKEIARRLGKSPNTVDNQLRRIRAKLGVHNQVELVRASSGLI
jgi:DNA-binding CsgD family transcriptional regulator